MNTLIEKLSNNFIITTGIVRDHSHFDLITTEAGDLDSRRNDMRFDPEFWKTHHLGL